MRYWDYWAIGLLMAPIVVPVLIYLLFGYRVRRRDVVTSFTSQAKAEYLAKFLNQTFAAQGPPGSKGEAAADAEFTRMYERRFGRKFFVLPILIFLPITFFAIALAVVNVRVLMGATNPYPTTKLALPAIYAVAGAYMWIATDFIRRAHRDDFSPTVIFIATLRWVIAVPLGYALASLAPAGASGTLGPALAFAMGAFPLDQLNAILRRLSMRALTLDNLPEENSDLIAKLQGIDRDIADRLQQQGITTIPQLAYCDPILITIRANLSFNFVVDIVSQALAWLYFDEHMKNLHIAGLRGAWEMADLLEELDLAPLGPKATVQQAQRLAEATNALNSAVTISGISGMTADGLRFALREVAEDPYTQFLRTVWT